MITDDDVSKLKETFATKEDLAKLEKKVDRGFKKINKTLDLIVRMFDRDIVKTIRRVDRIEDHLKLPPLP